MNKVLPILFNTDMVREILTGRKTVTRRPVKYKYSNTEMKMHTDKYGTRLIEIQKDVEGETFGRNEDGTTWHKLRGYVEPKPPYHTGDILYVRETWCEEYGRYYYRTDFDSDYLDACETLSGGYPSECKYYPGCVGCTRTSHRIRWRPSIHMPKAAARIWLKVTDVRVERLLEITAEQAEKEGVGNLFLEEIYCSEKRYGTPMDVEYGIAKEQFAWLWDSTIKKSDLPLYGWGANPWVWVIEFEQCEKPVNLTIMEVE